jgi:8-oxo-dGTP pyrophosphatase MutT (NUDIX family)
VADIRDKWSDSIDAAFPTRSGSHEEWATAMEMVGNRHTKDDLVELVNWLLVEKRLVAGLERDVAKLNSEAMRAGIRARGAERERDEALAKLHPKASPKASPSRNGGSAVEEGLAKLRDEHQRLGQFLQDCDGQAANVAAIGACVERMATVVGAPPSPVKQVRACVSVLALDGLRKRVLLGRYNGRNVAHRGFWMTPAGGIEFGERWIDALAREFLEETGAHLVTGLVAADHQQIFEDVEQGILLIFVEARFLSTETMILRGGSDLQDPSWFNLNDLPSPLSPITVQALRRFRV